MTSLTPKQEELCATSRWDFSDLRAVYINCTLKRSPEISHTQGLADRSIAIMERKRLYGNSHLLNDAGQYAYYGRVGGCLVTGNEDGIKHCAMNILYSLQHRRGARARQPAFGVGCRRPLRLPEPRAPLMHLQ